MNSVLPVTPEDEEEKEAVLEHPGNPNQVTISMTVPIPEVQETVVVEAPPVDAAPIPDPVPLPEPESTPESVSEVPEAAEPAPDEPPVEEVGEVVETDPEPVSDVAEAAGAAAEAEAEVAIEAAEAAGLDMAAVEAEYIANGGELSPETLAHIVDVMGKVNVSEQQVAAYFRGLKALQEVRTLKAQMALGGADVLDATLAWARDNLNDQDLAGYNAMADGPDDEQYIKAIRLLHTQYRESSMVGGERVQADTGGAPVGEMISSQSELAERLADPAVATSLTKQKELQELLRRSVEQGFYKG